MATKMQCVKVILIFTLVNSVLSQGSGRNGNLRLCVVRGSGFNRPARYCPVLDAENSGVECVLGADRLDCFRRIRKGTVDFGVFYPEDLVAARWAGIDVLVTSELRGRSRPYERSVVAVVNKRIQAEGASTLHAVLQNTTLCHPGVSVDDIRPLSDTIQGYLEHLVIPPSCDPSLTLAENRIKAMAEFFSSSCKAGPWVLDEHRDAQLKTQYHSLCAACVSPNKCSKDDAYWGDVGALACLLAHGDVAWADLDDVTAYFGLKSNKTLANADNFQFLCRDAKTQPLSTERPCVWLYRPWPVIVATRKSAEAVAAISEALTNGSVVVDPHWRGALANLVEAHGAQPEPLRPPVPAEDYLSNAQGFRDAYSQTGCNPPRHVNLCTTSNLERSKCEWLSEAAAVYGIVPPLQCIVRPDVKSCMEASEKDEAVVLADSNWLFRGVRDYHLQALLHEVTPVVEQTHTVVAYVRADSGIDKMADIRGKRAAFPEYDGLAWHAVLRYIKSAFDLQCKGINKFFSQICAPGFEKVNGTADMTASCYRENGTIVSGEIQALRALVEGKTDVAFISMETFNMYTANIFSDRDWAMKDVSLKPVCPEETTGHCFISWANLGHVFASKTMSAMRKQDIVNVFLKLDKHFGKRTTFHSPMFALYGSFDSAMNVIFHNNTKLLATEDQLNTHPYNKIPRSFERSLLNSTDSCQVVDFTNLAAKVQPSMLLLVTLVSYFLSML